MTPAQLQAWREEYIELKRDFKRDIPELKKNQEKMLGDIRDLQMAENNEQARIEGAATMAVEKFMSQKGRRLKEWSPIIIQLIITGGILIAAYIGYLGVVAQIDAAMGVVK